MPTPTGLPRKGEVWRLFDRRNGQHYDVTVTKRGSGEYWTLWVRGDDGKERMWVDASYFVSIGDLVFVRTQ